MLNTKPKTYNELLIASRINVIPRHYSITNLQLEKAFNFLMENPDGTIMLSKDRMDFLDTKGSVIESHPVILNNSKINGITISKKEFYISEAYTYVSGSGSGYSGGSSNNNNNNNNN